MIIRLITSGTKERKLLSSQGFWKRSLGDAIDYFHARRSTLTRISLFGPSFREWRSGSLAWRTTQRISLVGETRNGTGNFQREVIIAPGRRTLPR